MEPLTGEVYLDLVLALLTAMGGAKGANVLWRKYANGRASKYEPLTKFDLQEVMQGREDRTIEVLHEIRKAINATPQAYLKAVMQHYPISAEREQRDMLVKILDRMGREYPRGRNDGGTSGGG